MIFRISTAAILIAATCIACDKGPSDAQAEPAAKAVPASETGSAVAAPAVAAPAKTAKVDGKAYGEELTGSETTAIDAILSDPTAFEGKTVRVEGMVTDVCPKRGCWFDLAGTKPGQKLRFKVQDGIMVFPLDAKGKKAVAEGVVKVRKLTLEETKEYMEYQAKEYGKEYDPKSVTEPTMIVRIDGKGAVIRN